MSEKCIKCSKMIPDEQVSKGKQTPQGFVCANCNRKKKGGIIAGALIVAALLGGGGYWWYNKNINIPDGVDTEESNRTINKDSMPKKEREPFNPSKTLAISPTQSTNEVNNLEDFKRLVAENFKTAEENGTNQIAIPTISMLFEKGSYVLKQEAEDLLREFAKTYLQTNKQATLLIEGYTCDLGTDKLNDRLSERRAETIKNSLIAEGVPADKVETKWYGESQYGTLYKGREENRRVNVSVR